MFLTNHDLKLTYGVDLEIGGFYVDRPVPAENMYWKDRTIYVPGASGYIFIPIFSDLLFRCGAHKQHLFNEQLVQVQERILHSAALLEYGHINWTAHVSECISIAAPYVHRAELFDELGEYLQQDTPNARPEGRLGREFPSLNRADTYLFSLACISDDTLNEDEAIASWYALITHFLLMDDLADIREDLNAGEENALIQAGFHEEGIKKIEALVDRSIRDMERVNPVMANRIEHKKGLIDLHQLIASIRP
ncbi:MAG: hypothetical protein ACKO03_02940 [Bacteroidota bacterium]